MLSANATLSPAAAASPVSVPGGALTSLAVSVVVYRLQRDELARTLRTLHTALAHAPRLAARLTLIDNSEAAELSEALQQLAAQCAWPGAAVLSGHGNVGYGAGHNMAIRGATEAAYLVLNPDVELDLAAIRAGLATLEQPGIVLVGAVGRDGEGAPGYLSKRMPSVWTFFLRGFAPAWLRRRFDARLAHYEYRDLPADRVSDVVLVSGAFMLARTAALQAVGGFDERYFLHFEDLDLSLRMHTQGRVVSDPQVTLVHHGGHSARKGLAHLRLFLRSGMRFFNTHGWRWL